MRGLGRLVPLPVLLLVCLAFVVGCAESAKTRKAEEAELHRIESLIAPLGASLNPREETKGSGVFNRYARRAQV